MTTDGLRRRAFLQGAVATTGGVLLSGPLSTLLGGAASAARPSRALGPVADLRDGKVRLHLPEGFQYRSFHDTDTPRPEPDAPQPPVVLDDGTELPGRHDGMAAFAGPDGNVWLVRNHEVNGPVEEPFGPGDPYDAHAGGGTTTALVTPHGEVLEAFTSLNGTQMNCAGGRMPWGSWITCEETVNGPDVGPDFTGAPNVTLEQPHGFIFEVPAGGQSDRVPIRSAGRFAHEAAAYSPHDGCVYLTEDNFGFPSGFYRYVPPVDPMVAGRLLDGGRLQMLYVVGQPHAHLEAEQEARRWYDVDWIDIDDPAPTFPYEPGATAPTSNDEAIRYVGDQGRADPRGAAHFSRLEGAVFAKGEVWFTATQGGGEPEPELQARDGYGNGNGQVWSYDPRRNRLTCRYQSPDRTKLELPDNITARSSRGTMVLCEDGPVENYVRGLTPGGDIFDIALNQLHATNGVEGDDGTTTFPTRFHEEFAGATFSPDGDTLFVNIQASRGITFAIWGPWSRLGV